MLEHSVGIDKLDMFVTDVNVECLQLNAGHRNVKCLYRHPVQIASARG